MANIVALVGRPNVGKSTLFNRLTQSRHAIVDPTPGVTRDRHYGKCDWNGIDFSVIDTGGYVVGSDDIFEEQIRRQVYLAVEEANVILFLVDTQEGVTPMDEDVAQILRRSGKPVLLVANKVDSSKHNADAAGFYQLGMGEVYAVSAISGSGTGDLLDAVVESLSKEVADEFEESLPRFAIIGRPNVGKSSLINALIGQERNIVTNIPGTTRDSIYTRYKSFGMDFYLVDTAGLRKKGKVSEDIEFYSVMRSIKAIENSDVCILLIDATHGFQAQDLNIFSLAARNGKGLVVLVNKWDLVEKDHKTSKEYEAIIKEAIAPFRDVPIVFTSAITKQRIFKAMQDALQVYQNRLQKISTSKLNEVLLPIIEAMPPPAVKDKYVRIKYITQLPTEIPSFAFFCNLPQYIREPYERFLENKIREKWNFSGVPIRIFFRQK
ncbi:MAG TPA: ribosome biogenesis GTPase Der [Bacteroidales bacterium]|nr:ribosome biogenesis GTPase Der [Bacteroidales bacterium]